MGPNFLTGTKRLQLQVSAWLAIFFFTTSLSAQPSALIQPLQGQAIRVSMHDQALHEAVSQWGVIQKQENTEQPAYGENSASKSFIVHIQDAHANFSAQKNMAGLIKNIRASFEQAAGEYGIPADQLKIGIAVEGIAGEVDFGNLLDEKRDEAMMQTADLFLEEALITGAEYALLTSEKAFEYFGIEDSDLLNQNVFLYGEVMRRAAAASEGMNRLRAKIAKAQSQMKNKNLQMLYAKQKEAEENKEHFLDYVTWLMSETEAPQIKTSVLRAVFKLHQAIDQVKLENEMIRAGENWRSLNPVLMLFYPNLRKQLAYEEQAKMIDMDGLMPEIRHMEAALKTKWIETPAEKRFEQVRESFRTLEKLSRLEMSPENMESFRIHRASILRDLKENLTDEEWMGISAVIDAAEAFYVTARERDEVMSRHLMDEIQKRGLHLVFVIAGGFHTQGLSQSLLSLHQEPLVIMPRISGVNPSDREIYQKRLGGDVHFSWQTVWMRYFANGPAGDALVNLFSATLNRLRNDASLTARQAAPDVTTPQVVLELKSPAGELATAGFNRLIGAIQTAAGVPSGEWSFLGPQGLETRVEVIDPVNGTPVRVAARSLVSRMTESAARRWLQTASAKSELRSGMTEDIFLKTGEHYLETDQNGAPVRPHPGITFAKMQEIVERHRNGELGIPSNGTSIDAVAKDRVSYAQRKPLTYDQITSTVDEGQQAIAQNQLAMMDPTGGYGGRAIGYHVTEWFRIRILQIKALKIFNRLVDAWELLLGHVRYMGRKDGGNIAVLNATNEYTHGLWQRLMGRNRNFGLASGQVTLHPQGSVPSMNPALRDFEAMGPDATKKLQKEVIAFLKVNRAFAAPKYRGLTDAQVEALTVEETLQFLIEQNGDDGGYFKRVLGQFRWKTLGHFPIVTNAFLDGHLYNMWQEGRRWIWYNNDTDLGRGVDEKLLSYFIEQNRDEIVKAEMLALLVVKNITYKLPKPITVDDDEPIKELIYRKVRQADGSFRFVSAGRVLPEEYQVTHNPVTAEMTITKDGEVIVENLAGKFEKGGVPVNIDGSDAMGEAWALPAADNFIAYAITGVAAIPAEQSQLVVQRQVGTDGQVQFEVQQAVSTLDTTRFRVEVDAEGRLNLYDTQAEDAQVVQNLEGSAENFNDGARIAEYNPANYIISLEAIFKIFGLSSPDEFPEFIQDQERVNRTLDDLAERIGLYWEIKEFYEPNEVFRVRTAAFSADGTEDVYQIVLDKNGNILSSELPEGAQADIELVEREEEDETIQRFEVTAVRKDGAVVASRAAGTVAPYRVPRYALEPAQLLGDLTFLLNTIFVTIDRDSNEEQKVGYGVIKETKHPYQYRDLIANVLSGRVDLLEDPSQSSSAMHEGVTVTPDMALPENEVVEARDALLATPEFGADRLASSVTITDDAPSVDEYLVQEGRRFITFLQDSDFRRGRRIEVVLGHSSPDVDSVYSSVSRAYLRYLELRAQGDKNTIVVPVINTVSQDEKEKMDKYRRDIAAAAERIGISQDAFYYYHEIERLLKSVDETQLTVRLTDHHTLVAAQEYLQDRVAEIIDHHDVDQAAAIQAANRGANVWINRIGSSSTLVAEMIRNPEAIPADVAVLLAAGLQSDTSDLTDEAKVTDRDLAVIAHVDTALGGASVRSQNFDLMMSGFLNNNGLSDDEVLEKDPRAFTATAADQSPKNYGIYNLIVGKGQEDDFWARVGGYEGALARRRGNDNHEVSILNVNFLDDHRGGDPAAEKNQAYVVVSAANRAVANDLAEFLAEKLFGLQVVGPSQGASGQVVLRHDQSKLSRKRIKAVVDLFFQRAELRPMTAEVFAKVDGNALRNDADGKPVVATPGVSWNWWQNMLRKLSNGELGIPSNATVIGELGRAGYPQKSPASYAEVERVAATSDAGPQAIRAGQLSLMRSTAGYGGRAIGYNIIEFLRIRSVQVAVAKIAQRFINGWEFILAHVRNRSRVLNGNIGVISAANEFTLAGFQKGLRNWNNYGLQDGQVVLHAQGSVPSLNPRLLDLQALGSGTTAGIIDEVRTYIQENRDFLPQYSHLSDNDLAQLSEADGLKLFLEINGGQEGDYFRQANGEFRWKTLGHLPVATNAFADGYLYQIWKEGRRYLWFGNDTDMGFAVDPQLLTYFIENEKTENVEMMGLLVLKNITYKKIPGLPKGQDELVVRKVRQSDGSYQYIKVDSKSSLPDEVEGKAITWEVDPLTNQLTVKKDGTVIASGVEGSLEKGGVPISLNGQDALGEIWALPDAKNFLAYVVDGLPAGHNEVVVEKIPTDQADVFDYRVIESVSTVDLSRYQAQVTAGKLSVKDTQSTAEFNDIDGTPEALDPNRIAEYNPANYILSIKGLFRIFGLDNPDDFPSIDPNEPSIQGDREEVIRRREAMDQRLEEVARQVGLYWEVKEFYDPNSVFKIRSDQFGTSAEEQVRDVVLDLHGDVVESMSTLPDGFTPVIRDGKVVEVIDDNGAPVAQADQGTIKELRAPRYALEPAQLFGDLTFLLKTIFVTIDRDRLETPVGYGVVKTTADPKAYGESLTATTPLDVMNDPENPAAGVQEDFTPQPSDIPDKVEVEIERDRMLEVAVAAAVSDKSELRYAAALVTPEDQMVRFLTQIGVGQESMAVIYDRRLPTEQEVEFLRYFPRVSLLIRWDNAKYTSVLDRREALATAGLEKYLTDAAFHGRFHANLTDREASGAAVQSQIAEAGVKRTVVVTDNDRGLTDPFLILKAEKLKQPLPLALLLSQVEGEVEDLPMELRVITQEGNNRFSPKDGLDVGSLMQHALARATAIMRSA